jgi:hypothetical protein
MANKKTHGNQNRGRRDGVATPTPFEEARDELFQHVMQCGVIGAEPNDQREWFDATVAYLTDRYPELSPTQLQELRTLGERFAQPPKRQTATSAA